jgi:capsular polysaccharide biosynthesis protein
VENNTDDEIVINLKDIAYLLRKKLWIIILATVIGASVAGIATKLFIQPIYTSTAKLYIVSKDTTLTSLADLQLGTQLTQDYMVLVKSRPVVNQVIENLELDSSYNEMLNMITLSNPSDTRILEITVKNSDPFMAKEIVDEFAHVSKMQIAKIMNMDEPTIVEDGFMESFPTSPNTKKNVVIGALVGIFLSCTIIILIYMLDDTIKSSEDVEKYLGLNTIGIIPIDTSTLKIAEADRRSKRKRKKMKNAKKKNGNTELEEKVEVAIEEKVEEIVEGIVDVLVEEKVEEKVEDKVNEKVEEKVEDKVKAVLEEKVEKSVREKVEDKVKEDKVEEEKGNRN